MYVMVPVRSHDAPPVSGNLLLFVHGENTPSSLPRPRRSPSPSPYAVVAVGGEGGVPAPCWGARVRSPGPPAA